MCSGEVACAFAVVRPPGHHAECARAMGFCFYNNVAVGALHALSPAGGCARVLVLDWVRARQAFPPRPWDTAVGCRHRGLRAQHIQGTME